jgi:hypothetical protein
MHLKTLGSGEASGKIATSRLLQSLAKMMALLLFLYTACDYGYPVAVCVVPIWGIWLWVAAPSRKARVLSALGLGLTALGWWAATLLWSHFARGLEGTHFSQDRGYWIVLMRASENLSTILVLAGIMLLAWADCLRPNKPQPALETSSEALPDQSHVWPPAPKRPPVS